MITIFTPTFNRSTTLPRLFESILNQTCLDFEWIIVDDGSTDDTEQLVKSWTEKCSFSLHYIKQENGGKHRAHNVAVSHAKGDLFFIVDSDDYIPKDAIELLEYHYNQIKDDEAFCGVAGSKCFPDGRRVGGEVHYDILDTDVVTYRQKLRIKGDMAEVWKPSVLKEYLFPEFPGEKFITEALVWNEIAKNYKLRFFNKPIYYCEYLMDGLTNNINRHHRNSPQGSMSFYSSIMNDNRFSIISRLKAAINFWRYAIGVSDKQPTGNAWAWFTYPIGMLLYLKDKYNKV